MAETVTVVPEPVPGKTLEELEAQAAKDLAAHQAQVQADHDAASADSAKKFPEYFQAEETTK